MSSSGSKTAETLPSPDRGADATLVDRDSQLTSGIAEASAENDSRQFLTASDGSGADPFDEKVSTKLYDESQRRLGRYVILEELGRGGMGVVHAAYDERLGRKVAIKIVREQEADEGSRGQTRLLREAQAMAQLTHPNIVTIFDVGKNEDGIFLAMEYVPGQTLYDWLDEDQPAWKVVKTFIEAGRGLVAAHEQGIVHRDFKPANVLIGRDGRIKVADFGLAAIDSSSDSTTGSSASTREVLGEEMTHPGARVGTPAYMSPEQHQGKTATGLSDQFAFCVSLWEGLFGSHPFPAPTQFARAERVTTGKLEAPRNPGRAPEAVRKLLEKGLKPKQEDRHRSMRELLHLLETALTPGVTEGEGSSHRVPEFGNDSKTILSGRYRLLDPHPASSLLHVALDRLTGTFLALQWAGGRDTSGSSAHKEIRLSDQFRALDGIEHPNLVGVKDFGYDNYYGAFLVHALPRDAQLLNKAARRASFDVQLNLLMDVVRAVGFLHSRGVHGFGLSANDVVVTGGRAQLLLQFMPRGQRSDKEVAAHQDMARLAELALNLLGGERNSSGDRISDWNTSGVSPELAVVLTSLREEDAHVSAPEITRQISQTVGKRLEYETPETREATLRTIALVGRGSALRTVKGRLLSAIDSKGSFCLVTGESGIGKSRFTDECRTLTLDSGNRFFGGQAESETAIAYQIWQGPLRGLIAETPISDFEASVLAWVIPDLDQVTGTDVTRAVELDGQAMRVRLTEVVEQIIKRQSRALVIALEDLQWADPDSITLLEELRENLKSSQVLFLGTTRTEESDTLIEELRADEEIHLRSLGEKSVQKLSRRIVADRKHARSVADYVFRHSEGNPLFVAEVFRALADEAGSLSDISAASLPHSPKTGGLRRAIQERLARLPDKAFPLLQIAAIAGRQFDPQVLETARPLEEVDAWLALVKTPAIIEQHAEAWRFSHDKLREAILDQIPEDERKLLHREVGEAIEKLSGGEQHALLAHHFAQAGDSRAARYSGLAGAEIVHSSPEEAVRLLTQASELGQDADEQSRRRWGRLLAEALFDQGKVPEARRGLEQVCELSQVHLPTSRFGWIVRLVQAVVVQLLHLLFSQPKATNHGDHWAGELVKTYDKLAEIYFFQAQNLKAMTLCLLALNEGDRKGTVGLNSLGIIAQTAAVLRLRKVSNSYFARGRAALELDSSLFHATFFMMETFVHAAEARFDEARQSALEGFEQGQKLGHIQGACQCLSALGLSEYNEGKFEAMLSRYETIFRSKKYNPEHDSGSSGGAGTAHAMLGNEAPARQLIQRALEGASEQIPIMASSIHAGLALVLSRLGDHREACREADLAMVNFEPNQLPSVLTTSLIGPLDAYVGAWHEARENEPQLVAELEEKAVTQVKHFYSFSRLYPMAQGFALLGEGRVLLLQGKQKKALRAFEDGLRHAQRNKTRHCEAQLRVELARLSPRGSDSRLSHLAEAASTFQDLGALPDLKKVRDLQRSEG